MQEQRVLDGRRTNGQYNELMIKWFDEHDVNTTLIDVNTVRVHKSRQGRYITKWGEAQLIDGDYVRNSDGSLRLWSRSKTTLRPPYWEQT